MPVTKLQPNQWAHHSPQFIPDGRHFLFYAMGNSPDGQGIYLGSLDGTEPKRLTARPTPRERIWGRTALFLSSREHWSCGGWI